MNLFIYLIFSLFSYVLTEKWKIIPKHYYAYQNNSITCDDAEIWYIRKPFSYSDEPIDPKDSNYRISKNSGLTIMKPTQKAIYKAKSDPNKNDFVCQVQTLLYVYPDEYNAYFIFNNVTMNVSFLYDKNSNKPLNYTIDLVAENPENFSIDYTYQVEGVPVDNLFINGETQKIVKCISKITNYDCLQVNNIIQYQEKLELDFSYYVIDLFTDVINVQPKPGHIVINFNVEYPPLLKSYTKINVKRTGKYTLNCTERYSNPKVESYKWSSTTNGTHILNTTDPIYELQYNYTLDNIIITCNASNGKYYSLAYFEISKVEKAPQETIKSGYSTYFWIFIGGICFSILVIVVLTIVNFATKRYSLERKLPRYTDALKRCFIVIEKNRNIRNIYERKQESIEVLKKVKGISLGQKLSNEDLSRPHMLTAVVKEIIKDMKLFNRTLYETISNKMNNDEIGTIKDYLMKLNNGPIIIMILTHLKEVSEASEKNHMDGLKLATEIAPFMFDSVQYNERKTNNQNTFEMKMINDKISVLEYMIDEIRYSAEIRIIKYCVGSLEKSILSGKDPSFVITSYLISNEESTEIMMKLYEKDPNEFIKKIKDVISAGAMLLYAFRKIFKYKVIPKQAILDLMKRKQDDQLINDLKELLYKLKYRRIILYFFGHLIKVAEYASRNDSDAYRKVSDFVYGYVFDVSSYSNLVQPTSYKDESAIIEFILRNARIEKLSTLDNKETLIITPRNLQFAIPNDEGLLSGATIRQEVVLPNIQVAASLSKESEAGGSGSAPQPKEEKETIV